MRVLVAVLGAWMALAGCTEQREPPAGAAAPKAAAGNPIAGKAVAERDCKACHGLDGVGVAPGIPNLAAQRERYLLAALGEYRERKRTHAALREMTQRLGETERRDVAAYFANLAPVVRPAPGSERALSPYEEGRQLAAACAKCHGEDGNSRTAGTPSLAGQQPHYLVAAIQEYHQGERKTGSMRSMLREASRRELESLAQYFAAQPPAQRPAPAFGDPAAGEPASAMCGGCHGARGVSTDAATPSLAGQDPKYLIKSIKAYRTARQHWGMQRYVAGLSEKDMENIAAYYVVQKPHPAESVPSSIQELADKCNRCHDSDSAAAMPTPKMRGQDKDYLVRALRAYRDGKRESSAMHTMSSIYSNAVIESIATFYASQAAR